MRLRRAGLLCALALLCVACPTPPPIVNSHVFAKPSVSIRKVAVMAFYPRPDLERYASRVGIGAEEAAELISRFVAEALTQQGLLVVPASDMALVFAGLGMAPPRRDPRRVARVASQEFGVDAVVLGEVYRYRDRGGEGYGTLEPASVSFMATLYESPGGRKLRSARFDETQEPLTANVLNTPRYPGGGMRWLTVGELARWGAENVAKQLAATP